MFHATRLGRWAICLASKQARERERERELCVAALVKPGMVRSHNEVSLLPNMSGTSQSVVALPIFCICFRLVHDALDNKISHRGKPQAAHISKVSFHSVLRPLSCLASFLPSVINRQSACSRVECMSDALFVPHKSGALNARGGGGLALPTRMDDPEALQKESKKERENNHVPP